MQRDRKCVFGCSSGIRLKYSDGFGQRRGEILLRRDERELLDSLLVTLTNAQSELPEVSGSISTRVMRRLGSYRPTCRVAAMAAAAASL